MRPDVGKVAHVRFSVFSESNTSRRDSATVEPDTFSCQADSSVPAAHFSVNFFDRFLVSRLTFPLSELS